jgi:hypothetical protein
MNTHFISDTDLIRAYREANRLAFWEADLRARGRVLMADDVATMIDWLRNMEPLAKADGMGMDRMAAEQRLADARGQTMLALAGLAGGLGVSLDEEFA